MGENSPAAQISQIFTNPPICSKKNKTKEHKSTKEHNIFVLMKAFVLMSCGESGPI